MWPVVVMPIAGLLLAAAGFVFGISLLLTLGLLVFVAGSSP